VLASPSWIWSTSSESYGSAWTPSAPLPSAELLHVLMLPDFEGADRIGEFWGYPQSRAFAELLIDCEEDLTLRAVLVGMLREADARSSGTRAPRAKSTREWACRRWDVRPLGSGRAAANIGARVMGGP
jgi:hypothetical protein